jgi:uncharacterized membrane protein
MIPSDIALIIAAGAVVTFGIRIGGYGVLSRFRRLHPRVIAGLDAVPAAVLTAIVAPAAAEGELAEIGALLAATAVSILGWGSTAAFFGGSAALVLLRYLIG